MVLEEVLYSIGEGAERLVVGTGKALWNMLFPKPSEEPPSFKVLRKLVKRDVTLHELLSLKLQLILITYLVLSLLVTLFLRELVYLIALFVVEFLYIRYTIKRNWGFFIDPEPYRFFYCGISVVAFLSFMGYIILREFALNFYYYYVYLVAVLAGVLLFRWYFRRLYGRDYTYGVVVEVKNDVIRVFVHDDLAANIKPGHYWVPAVPDAEPGRVVKLLIEDRVLRGAVPTRVLEVYLGDQSSQISTEPNVQAE
ncbi:hypothetical protein A3L09_08565 [Thermococcus profundus]|uniref:DUF2101 domain-containing protein n=1 Tax=Thermococcus profundus TaxID=49899 RepID=A0A2Z2MH85_THEPR|nr:DUF2101 family protein [Thermococcus profundus]ASJ03304.1 hypothetical protein A3L09_08565 [Thermococcus profundus]